MWPSDVAVFFKRFPAHWQVRVLWLSSCMGMSRSAIRACWVRRGVTELTLQLYMLPRTMSRRQDCCFEPVRLWFASAERLCIDPGSRGCFVPHKRTMCTRSWTRTSIRSLTVLLAQAAGVVEEPPALTFSLAIGSRHPYECRTRMCWGCPGVGDDSAMTLSSEARVLTTGWRCIECARSLGLDQRATVRPPRQGHGARDQTRHRSSSASVQSVRRLHVGHGEGGVP